MDDEIILPNTSPSDINTSGNPTARGGIFQNIGGHIAEFIETFVVIGAIFALLYLFVAQPHKVSGKSMFPTYDDGDFIFTDKISYKIGEVKKGDVVVLKNPKNEAQDFIKRVMALPHDKIKIEGGRVYVNGNLLEETYLPANTNTRSGAYIKEGEEITAGDNQYLVIGDNRDHSSDSRAWGPVKKEEIIGRVFFRYWPPNVFGLIK